eukprot:TRINITY_DN2871_c0_g3_i1.p1 TRINITY_DN2871_c0_g3~~TRINITY_DN2871_c0_g3_i1.p1  ORF type:complete len:494 (+),score=186.56 TRINITY_DN2871_c0_g3_i1:58-1539(+)
MASEAKYLETVEDKKTKELLCELCRQFYHLGWVTGTGGSISIKNSQNKIFMSPSSVQKERMQPPDIYVMDADGVVIQEGVNPDGIKLKLSQCHPLFMSAYLHRNSGAVIHTHSVHAVMVSLLFEKEFRCTHLEMIKGLEHHGYLDELVIPIIDNTPHEEDLKDSLTQALLAYPRANAVIVRRHGVYVWGRDWRHAKAQCECLDYLMQVAVQMRQIGLDPTDPTSIKAWNASDEKHDCHVCTYEKKVDAIVMDVEGTATPIDFVHTTMFGYIKENLHAYLESTWASQDTQDDVKVLRELAEQDAKEGKEGVVLIPSAGSDAEILAAVENNVRWQMGSDRKSLPLKQLQGHMWKSAFENGQLAGELYEDVKPCIDSWKRRGYQLYVYSSGSIFAQKLLFGHARTLSGVESLLPQFSGHFDLTTGSKREADSYRKIALKLNLPPSRVLFLTDIFAEAQAAAEAGMRTVLLVRPGNAELPPQAAAFETVTSFADLRL